MNGEIAINSIKQYKRRPLWYKVDANGQIIDIHQDILNEYRLSKWSVISYENLQQIQRKCALKLLTEKAVRKLASKSTGKKDLSLYLGRKLYEIKPNLFTKEESKEIIRSLINDLEAKHYVSDSEYAKNLIKKRLMQSNPRSINMILKELAIKGVEKEVIRNYTKGLNQQLDIENARKFVDKNKNRLSREKLISRLANRGFTYDTITNALLELPENEV